VGLAPTTSMVVELDIVVEMGVGEGEFFETLGDPLGFVSGLIVSQSVIVFAPWPDMIR